MNSSPLCVGAVAVVVAALGNGHVVELVAKEVDLGQTMHRWKFTGCAPGNIYVAYHEVTTCLFVLDSDLGHCPTFNVAFSISFTSLVLIKHSMY